MRSKHTVRLQIQEDIIFDFFSSEMEFWVDEVVDSKKKKDFMAGNHTIFFRITLSFCHLKLAVNH